MNTFLINLFAFKFKESSGDKARRVANRELNEMAERLSVDKSTVVIIFIRVFLL